LLHFFLLSHHSSGFVSAFPHNPERGFIH
jgi:hypothetical protein